MRKFRDEAVKQYKKLLERWNKLSKQQQYGVGGVAGLLVILTLIFSINVLASSLNTSNVTITIKDQVSEETIAKANVLISSPNTKPQATNNDGQAKFKGVKYGLYEVSISHQDYAPLSQEINVNKRSGDFTIYITKSGMATISGTIKPANGILIKEGIVIRAGDQQTGISSSDTFVLNNVAENTEALIIESPDYEDITIPLNLNSGNNQLEAITLKPAYDYSFRVIDFISKAPMKGAQVGYNGKEYKSDETGTLLAKDIPISEKPELTITQQGYVPKSITPEAKANNSSGKNNSGSELKTFELTPQGKILYTSERDGKSSIYTANYDGSEETKINSSGESANITSISPEFSDIAKTEILFYGLSSGSGNSAAQKVFKSTVNGQIPQLVSVPSEIAATDKLFVQEYYFLPAQKKLRYTRSIEDKKTKLLLQVANMNNTALTKVYETEVTDANKIIEFRSFKMSSSGSDITFIMSESAKSPFKHLKSSVVTYNLKNNSAKTLKEVVSDSTSLFILATAKNNDYVVLTDTLASTKNQITVINTASNIKADYDSLNIFESFAQVSNDSKFLYFISVRDSKSDVYRLEFQTGTVEKITDTGNVLGFYVDTNNILQYQVGSDLLIMSMNPNTSRTPVKTPVSTNFEMWSLKTNM